MPKPIAVTDGICFAFPDVLLTPAPPAPPVPIPYPNIAQLADAKDTADTVNAGGKAVILEGSSITDSSGGEAGSSNPIHLDECKFTQASGTVKANGQGIVRQLDTTSQNAGNAIGMVMSGNATVLVGD
jgi:hypothetical protein